jgi:hypothetical protein
VKGARILLIQKICAFKQKREALFWFIVALTVRSIAVIAIHIYSEANGFRGFYPLASGNDDRYYWSAANKIFNGVTPDKNLNVYPNILSSLFYITGPNLFAGKMLNVFFSSLSVYFGVALVKELGSKSPPEGILGRAPHWAGLFLTLYPSSVFYATQLLKDQLIILFGILSLYLAVRFTSLPFSARGLGSALLWFVTISLVYIFRPYAAVAICITVFLYVILSGRKWLPAVLILAAIFACSSAAGLLEWSHVGSLKGVYQVEHLRQNVYSAGGSSFGIKIDFKSPAGFMTSYTYSFATAMFGPFPWQLRSMVHLIAVPETLVMWLLLPAWFTSVAHLVKNVFLRRLEKDQMLILVSLLLVGVIALYSDNMGANTRLRVLPWSAFLLYVALHPPRWLEKVCSRNKNH